MFPISICRTVLHFPVLTFLTLFGEFLLSFTFGDTTTIDRINTQCGIICTVVTVKEVNGSVYVCLVHFDGLTWRRV